jgi:(4-(4-[2-(gamma-L-glutamylamino)ethyl]phenoxymethyl)furan-2-yl)methanamine synthase
MSGEPAVIGWDIGGVNLKAVRLASGPGLRSPQSLCHPFEVQHALSGLTSTVQALARQLAATDADRHAITMTAELSQAFRCKREGIAWVLDAFEAAFGSHRLQVYSVEGEFVSPDEARRRPLSVAASNWAATAHWIAQRYPAAILIDVGSTTTDIIPIADGKVAATGQTDPERLTSGELVYTGALRTPVEAIVHCVPLWGSTAGVSAEGFALIGDVHLWLRHLQTEDYTCRTPDGRPANREYAGERLARLVCGDREMLDDKAIDALARHIAGAQITAIGQAIGRVRARQSGISLALVTGLGEFIATEAALSAGLTVVSLTHEWRVQAQAAPAAAVAALLSARLQAEQYA